MKAVWTQACLLLAGSLIALASGVWMVRTAGSQARIPDEILGTRKVLNDIGGEQGLQSRKQSLNVTLQHLRLERAAKTSDARGFSQRLEEVFAELDLVISSSSQWQAVPEFQAVGAVAFERTFAGVGAFEALLDAVHTIESWPDRARIRALTATAEAPGRVAFTLEITAVRIPTEQETKG